MTDPATTARTTVHPGQWRLDRVELVNWGTFHGHHAIDVARKGFLLTGSSGSGKSSLVDAISAVLTPRGKIRFNAAASDGTAARQDRTIVSYVRGAWRRTADEDTGEVTSQYLRPGATWSGIALRYSDGTSRPPVTLFKLYHLRRGAMTAAEASELHLMTTDDVGLLDLESFAKDGLDVRAIKRQWPSATVEKDHAKFSPKFSRVLGVSGLNALLLLHKTQSAKNLGSLDDLFRTFMLDEPGTFEMARKAVEQFRDLAQAHRSVVEARQQIEHLAPLEQATQRFDAAVSAAQDAAALSESLEPFTDAWGLELARQERTDAAADVDRARQEHLLAAAAAHVAEVDHDRAKALMADRGGDALAQQDLQIAKDQQALEFAAKNLAALTRDLRSVGIAAPGSFTEFGELRTAGRLEQASADDDATSAEAAVRALHGERATVQSAADEVKVQLDALKHVRSNMSAYLLAARQLVSRATKLPLAALPFAGELLQVRAEHAEWAGAIERVLRPLSTVMLVPAAHVRAVSAAVDAAHLGTRLVFESIPARVDVPRRPGSEASLIYRVDVAESAMTEWLNHELARRFDYSCVESSEELAAVERGVTRAGQVKRGARLFEKDDSKHVGDRSRWVLGFDNHAKVELYLAEQDRLFAELTAIDTRLAAAERARRAGESRIQVLAKLQDLDWTDLDVTGAQEVLGASTRRRDELLAASTDLRAALHAASQTADALDTARTTAKQAQSTVLTAEVGLKALDKAIARLESLAGNPVPPAHHDALLTLFHDAKSERTVSHSAVDAISRRVGKILADRKEAAINSQRTCEQQIISITDGFAQKWRGALRDLTPGLDDRAGFLELLSSLRADRLPDFEQRFFELLGNQSRQNIGTIANEIRRAPRDIRERIDPINRSLRRSVFDEGRFLEIKVKEDRSAAAIEFLRDLNTITSESWGMISDDVEAERKFEIMERLMGKLESSDTGDQRWREQCLDTRRHVQFTGVEIDSDGTVVNVHDSGSGLSGGQKQKLVVFCLAAALRYQLAQDTEDLPAYASVVMDEAFDKADSDFARMAMDIFCEFGFHMILATPLKLLQTLEDYVDGIGLVTCADSRDSRIALVAFDELVGQETIGREPTPSEYPEPDQQFDLELT